MGFSRELRTYLAIVAAALLLVVVLHAVTRPRGIHLTTADRMVQSGMGYSAPPATATRAAIPGDWRPVTLPYAPRPSITASGSATQISWYALRVADGGAMPRDLYLYIPRWKSDGTIAIFVDGALLYQSHANLQWNGSNRPLWIAFRDMAGGHPPREILIRMQHVQGIGGALSTLWIGSYAELAPTYLVRNFFQAELAYLSTSAFLAAGVFALIVWLREGRRQTLYLMFFTVAVVTFVRGMHNYTGADRLPISDAWFGWLTVGAPPWMILNVHLFIQRFHGHRTLALTATVTAFTVGFTIATLPLLQGAIDATLMAPALYIGIIAMGTWVGVSGLYWSWRTHSLEGFALSLWGLLIIEGAPMTGCSRTT